MGPKGDPTAVAAAAAKKKTHDLETRLDRMEKLMETFLVTMAEQGSTITRLLALLEANIAPHSSSSPQRPDEQSHVNNNDNPHNSNDNANKTKGVKGTGIELFEAPPEKRAHIVLSGIPPDFVKAKLEEYLQGKDIAFENVEQLPS